MLVSLLDYNNTECISIGGVLKIINIQNRLTKLIFYFLELNTFN